jgi:hypothetical protein
LKKVRYLRAVALLLVFITFPFIGGCYIIYYSGDHEGRVVDAETGEPIEGAVVFLRWSTITPSPAGGTGQYFEARETLTDESGVFSIPGFLKVHLNLTRLLDEPHLVVFKAGYTHVQGTWRVLMERDAEPDSRLRESVRFENGKPIFMLREFKSVVERKKRHLPFLSGDIPKEQRALLMEEMNEENVELGYGREEY